MTLILIHLWESIGRLLFITQILFVSNIICGWTNFVFQVHIVLFVAQLNELIMESRDFFPGILYLPATTQQWQYEKKNL